MHYWNRANFEGLSQLVETLRRDARFEELVRYCELREQGLRGESFQALDRFLTYILAQPVQVRRDVAVGVVDAHLRVPAAHQFMTQPLRQRLLEPVLIEWSASDPDCVTPMAALGLLRCDVDLLKRTLQLDPQNDRARACLVSVLLGDVEYATHHLVEDLLIGTVDDASATLDEAEGHLRTAIDHTLMTDLVTHAAELRDLLADWRIYQVNKTGNFQEWCRARGKTHRWQTIVYYKR